MNQQNRSLFYNIDWNSIWVYGILVIIGWMSVFSSVYHPNDNQFFFDIKHSYIKHLINIVSAICLAITILLLEARMFKVFSWVFYGFTIFLLILVLFVGHSVGGNKSWIALGSFRLQPSEFAKFATCLALANYLGGTQVRLSSISVKLTSFLIIGIPMLLTLVQPDTGSALTFSALIVVLYREGLSPSYLVIAISGVLLFVLTLLLGKNYLIIALAIGLIVHTYSVISRRKRKSKIFIGILAFVCSIAFVFSIDVIYKQILKQHQRNRIDDLLGITTDLKGAGYNVNQSKIAIGSGGFWGKGFLHGTQTKFDFVPEQSTDFIFCTIGEEWGFIGSLFIVGIYVFLLMRIIFLAERQRSAFARIYGYGVACIIFCHFAINIGMTIGIVPVIGIPLPFVSYGGSSLWGFTILLFILLRLDANRISAG